MTGESQIEAWADGAAAGRSTDHNPASSKVQTASSSRPDIVFRYTDPVLLPAHRPSPGQAEPSKPRSVRAERIFAGSPSRRKKAPASLRDLPSGASDDVRSSHNRCRVNFCARPSSHIETAQTLLHVGGDLRQENDTNCQSRRKQARPRGGPVGSHGHGQ